MAYDTENMSTQLLMDSLFTDVTKMMEGDWDGEIDWFEDVLDLVEEASRRLGLTTLEDLRDTDDDEDDALMNRSALLLVAAALGYEVEFVRPGTLQAEDLKGVPTIKE